MIEGEASFSIFVAMRSFDYTNWMLLWEVQSPLLLVGSLWRDLSLALKINFCWLCPWLWNALINVDINWNHLGSSKSFNDVGNYNNNICFAWWFIVVSTCTIMQEVLWVKTLWFYCGFNMHNYALWVNTLNLHHLTHPNHIIVHPSLRQNATLLQYKRLTPQSKYQATKFSQKNKSLPLETLQPMSISMIQFLCLWQYH
jgi:hypothetical protein